MPWGVSIFIFSGKLSSWAQFNFDNHLPVKAQTHNVRVRTKIGAR